MDNAEHVDPHNKLRALSTDAAQDADISDLRADFERLEERVNRFDERLSKHNERHYLLMGIIATVSFLAGMGLKVFQ